MADNAEDKKARKELQAALKQLGIDGNFMALIDAAVRGDWSPQQFTVRLTRTEAFRNKFPGLIQNGNLNSDLVGGRDVGITASSLGTAIRAYEAAWKGYTEIAKNYGYGPVPRQKLAILIKSGVSPDEFGTRLAAIATVKKNPEVFDAFKAQAKLAGVNMQPKDLFKFAAKTADKKFYDIYEAAQLQTQIGLDASAAARAAKGVGLPGQATPNFEQTIAAVRQNLQQVGPELASQGITPAKLVKIMANPGSYVKEMEAIAQVIATREGLGRPVAGMYAQKGSAGGLALYEGEGQAAYG